MKLASSYAIMCEEEAERERGGGTNQPSCPKASPISRPLISAGQ